VGEDFAGYVPIRR